MNPARLIRRHIRCNGHLPQRCRVAGQSLVEVALILPVLLLVLSGTFEFGRLIYATTCVSHAARDGARYAMDATISDALVVTRVIDSASPITIGGDDVVVSPRSPGGGVTVRVTYQFSSSVPLISQFWGGGNLEITRARTARVQE